MVTSFCLSAWLCLELGKVSLTTFGLSSVDIMRKNNIRKNMMSFIEEVATSAVIFFFLRRFILQAPVINQ